MADMSSTWRVWVAVIVSGNGFPGVTVLAGRASVSDRSGAVLWLELPAWNRSGRCVDFVCSSPFSLLQDMAFL